MTAPYYQDEAVQLFHGDCLDILPTLPDASVDAVVTDPPYGLEFMGREWDGANGFRRSLNPDDAGRDSVFGRTSRTSPEYRTGSRATAGMSKPGIGDRNTEWPSHLGGLNPRCLACGKSQRGGSPCACDDPQFTNERLPRLHTFQAWCEQWAHECLRVLKPGGYMLAFGGTRTWHRLACAVEDAGFEIRDSLAWLYGSGFPKSLDVSKAIDRAAGAEREVVGKSARHGGGVIGNGSSFELSLDVPDLTAPATEAAKQWQGYGTALKPAFEPIVVARKPLRGTVAANVLEYGTGALNIDGCRIHTTGSEAKPYTVKRMKPGATLKKTGGKWRPEDDDQLPWEAGREYQGETKAGRWPANVVLDETSAAELDRQSGVLKSGAMKPVRRAASSDPMFHVGDDLTFVTEANAGGASRFFYTAKAPQHERPSVNGVSHPTVKPLDLMRWLVRLVTPPGGVVLDPFAGTGTTAEACIHEHKRCITIEREAEYLPLIVARLSKPMEIGFDFEAGA